MSNIENDANGTYKMGASDDNDLSQHAVQTPAAPWRARNIYSHVKVKRENLDRFIIIVIVIIGLLVAWFALNTKGLPVSFETYGGTPIQSVRYMYGDVIERPANPKLEGYVFVDWYPNQALIAPWDFEHDKVSSEMTLHAKWESKQDSTGVSSETTP